MDDFDQEPDAGADEFDDVTVGPAVTLPAQPPVAASATQTAVPIAATPVPAPPAAPNLLSDVIPGVELRRGGEQAIADMDKMALVDLLEPSMLTEYLTRTVGQYQAVVDVDAKPSHAITALMRQALLLVLANQSISRKSVTVAAQLEVLEPKLEAYLFAGQGSVTGRLQASIGTIVPAARKLLEDILVDADRLVFKLVKSHVDAAVDGHELVERRRDAERLTAERDVARAGEQSAIDRLSEYKELAGQQLVDAKRAGSRLAKMACAFGAVAGALVAIAIAHFAR
jgi:hypothetical protein